MTCWVRPRRRRKSGIYGVPADVRLEKQSSRSPWGTGQHRRSCRAPDRGGATDDARPSPAWARVSSRALAGRLRITFDIRRNRVAARWAATAAASAGARSENLVTNVGKAAGTGCLAKPSVDDPSTLQAVENQRVVFGQLDRCQHLPLAHLTTSGQEGANLFGRGICHEA